MTDDFLVVPLGVQGESMESFALGVVGNDTERLLDPLTSGTATVSGKNIVLLCDVLLNAYRLQEKVDDCLRQKAQAVLVVGLARFASFGSVRDAKTTWYVDLPYRESGSKEECPFCLRGVAPVSKEHFAQFADSVNEFDPYTFWELVSDVPNGYTVGHWKSHRTGHHYLHRINAGPVFERHGYGIAKRIWNSLGKIGILRDWVDCLICPDEPEATSLAQRLARCAGLEADKVVTVPRRFFGAVTVDNIPDELQKRLVDEDNADTLYRRNVVVVDQAAHHFATLFALARLCSYYEAHVLAVAVFLDRLDPAIDVADALPGAHYVPLYRWPWPPYKGDRCPCNSRRRL